MVSLCSSPDGSPNPIHIVADGRERCSPVISHLRSRIGVWVSVKQLAVGDYVVDDRLVVERKTIRDFARSVMDGRLFRQAHRMQRMVPRRRICLVLEGTAAQAA